MTSDWQKLPLLQGKTIVVTGCASGIGLETARLVTKMGGTVLGVDIKESTAHLTEFYQVDLGDQASIDRLVSELPTGIDGIANIAGLAPTASADMVVKVNLVGLKQFTLGMINKLNDGASIVNLASLAGEGWPRAIKEIKASENLSLDQVDEFLAKYGISDGHICTSHPARHVRQHECDNRRDIRNISDAIHFRHTRNAFVANHSQKIR